MKPFAFLALVLFSILSCKKEASDKNKQPDFYTAIKNIKAGLKDSLSSDDYGTLDFNRMLLMKRDDQPTYLIRIPVKGKDIKNDFVLLKVNEEGKIASGKMIHIQGNDTAFSNAPMQSFYGNITILSLSGTIQLHSAIHNGYILQLHSSINSRTYGADPNYAAGIELPEVIVYSYEDAGGLSFSEYYQLDNFFLDNTGYYGSDTGYYGSSDGSDSYDGGVDQPGNENTEVIEEPTLEVEKEYIYKIKSVDLHKMFKCFDNVPSPGASYTIKLCSDLPANSNPNASANYSVLSGGHSFLTITKTNGNTTVTQSFGFYPASMPSWINPFSPVSSAIKDNGVQEINASIEMNISEAQFNTVKQNAISWAAKDYELADYNCSDYAVDLFNSARSNPLHIPGYQIILPGSNPWAPAVPNTITINKSPQMLFDRLQEMKNNNDPEAPRIVIDQSHDYRAPVSKGECN